MILLTARTSDDTRLEGYETGADAYLTKPFKMDILEARIRNLIEERQGRISSFSKAVEVNPSEVARTSLDEKLMAKIMDSIERNMDNTDYSVEELSSDVSMHRMNLYRKLQSLVGMTPSEFIRTVRVKRAAQILSERPDISLSELADLVCSGLESHTGNLELRISTHHSDRIASVIECHHSVVRPFLHHKGSWDGLIVNSADDFSGDNSSIVIICLDVAIST